MIHSPAAFLTAHPGAHQFVKFCVVGLSSTIIDFGLLNVLHYRAGLPVALAATLSFFVAVCNGFYWNRRWTFRAGKGNARKQYPKFVATNLVGWALNLSIMTLVLVAAESLGLLHVKRTPSEVIGLIVVPGPGARAFAPLALNSAKALATVIVTAWNFSASKLWTFKQN